ncbi:class I SAM-dependent methyltransferase [Streptomyces diastatochromogenes]|nr:class I SAM-dependent methyltransferase [Streptomyces diastatochromogenes]
MTSHTISAPEQHTAAFADAFEAYDDLPERLIGYPAVFHALGIGSCAVRTVLDYGCGPGKVATRVVEASDASVIAVDRSPHMLELARTRRPHPRIDYRAAEDGGLGSLTDGSVDAAMACFVFTTTGDIADLHHIAAEAHRVLRPGGRFAVLDANPRTAGIRFSTFRGGEPGRVYTKGERRRSRRSCPAGRPCWRRSTTTGPARRTSTSSARPGSPTWTSTSPSSPTARRCSAAIRRRPGTRRSSWSPGSDDRRGGQPSE